MLGREPSAIHLVPDQADWALSSYADQLSQALCIEHDRRARVTRHPWRLRNQTVLFVDRYTFLDGPYEKLGRRNSVFLNWFHPLEEDISPLLRATPSLRGIITPCETTHDHLKSLGVPSDKLHIIPIGIDVELFRPRSEVRATVRETLGIGERVCLGSFQKDGTGWGEGLEPKLIKGPDVFVELAAALVDRGIDLVVLLTGPARGYVKRRLDTLGIDYIHRRPEDRRDMAKLYQALDLYAITSRVEGGPISLLESWASGVPIVSTSVGMSADLIRDRENGVLADVGDFQSLLDGALFLLSSQGTRQEIRSNGLSDVQALDWSKVAATYLELFRTP
jgi:glycosyltransferase involved in cell wall biosynthesis